MGKLKLMWGAIAVGGSFLVLQILLAILYRQPPIAPWFVFLIWPFTAFGLVLSMMPSILFKKYGVVDKGENFSNTKKVVDKWIYALVRHPQYASGIWISMGLIFFNQSFLSFICTIFITISFEICMNEEDKMLIEKFGREYIEYMKRTAQSSIVRGTYRHLKHLRT